MNAAVALLHAEAGTSPSGTGSYSAFSNFSVVVQNLGFVKTVGIWGRDGNTGKWTFHACAFSRSAPGNLEIWQGHFGLTPSQFAVEYQVGGNVYWDNNVGNDYFLNTTAAESTDGVGTAVIDPNVLGVSWSADGAGTLNVDVLVKNIAFAKQVAVIFTENNWASAQTIFGSFRQSFPPASTPAQLNAELWRVAVSIGVGKTGQFAVSYTVGGNTYWDNNFSANYVF